MKESHVEPNIPTKKANKRKRTDKKETCNKRLFENIPTVPTITQYNWKYGVEQNPYWYFTEDLRRQSADFVENNDELAILLNRFLEGRHKHAHFISTKFYNAHIYYDNGLI